MKERLITLYSGSPQRKALLEQMGLPFEVVPTHADESHPPGLKPMQIVASIAEAKLMAGLSGRNPGNGDWKLASDTLVCLEQELLGKPKDRLSAFDMIRRLSGRSHVVYTALVVQRISTEETLSRVHGTTVVFRELSDKEIEDYVSTGEWNGVAGGYRIQSRGAILIDRIEGLWSGVVGLPLGPLYGMLAAMSYPLG